MRYSFEIRKFVYSQYFFGGLRSALGISLPAVLMLTVFHNRELGFTIATGALGACVVDMPGPLKHKHNEMLACTFIGFFSALATGIATAHPVTLWLTVVPLTFVLSLIVVYGNRWPQISFATLFMMIVTLEEHFTPMQALINASWILLGGLWYTYWATLVSHLLVYRIERQALAQSIFSCAEYLQARAEFYDVDADLDECYRKLIEKQIAAVEQQEGAREIVLRNLPKVQTRRLDARRARLFNLFINIVDLHEFFVGAHTDYPLVRRTFAGSDVLVFYRDLMRKAGEDLEEIGLAVLQNRPASKHVSMKAELRAIEYELELMRKHALPEKNPEAYAAAAAVFRRLWSATRLIDKMRRRTHDDASLSETELQIDHALSRFISSRRVPFRQIFSNLTMSSPSFRHALRVTIAVGIGFWLGRLLPLTNAYWIVMTTVIILKPGYSLTKQRNTQRIIGTAIGCAVTIALILVVKDPHVLLVAMFASMVMSYSLLLFNYAGSVVFTSSYVLLMFHLLAPGSLRLIGERAIDTVVGCAIAIAASHLFPYWEYRLMGKLVKDLLGATRNYLEASWSWKTKAASAASRAPSSVPSAAFADANASAAHAFAPAVEAKADAVSDAPAIKAASATAERLSSVNIGESTAATASKGGSAAATVAATALDRDFRYRLARKNVHVAFANLAQAFQRMMLEPKPQQKYVAELNDLLVQSHVLASQITAAAPLLQAIDNADPKPFEPVQRAFGIVRDNLSDAQAVISDDDGAPPPDAIKELRRDLDTMVASAERAQSLPADAIQDLKLLAHQCKQMLTASTLIRKDAAQIHLPS
ncbi:MULTISPECIES: FUSC family membrane protein [unclassified Caballeronia]|uniref:FUSC family protein n=1 Tax=unclassified Caballeronia TaxID=2646786 RepID=UPI002860C35B|nr:MULTISPECIES: FUSC family membrane protein [unclassified Caballeronia]MDR5738779.1 FUSC family membrane protein [Caballeronia sp. LZ016]MDR5811353.1 FUSC family membrane protein [Caballeronia sp. LZ019]